MWETEIITPWAGSGIQTDKNRPQLLDDYHDIVQTDTTDQLSENLHPNPSIYIVKVTCEDAVLNAIEADNKYQVLWAEEVIPDATV